MRARNHGPATGDRENVFDRHQERLVHVALRLWHVLVHRIHQLVDLCFPLRLAVQRAQRRTAYHRHVVARELVLGQQLTHFHLDQVDQLRVFDRVALVQENHDVRHAHLPRQQHVLLGLRHRSIGRCNNENRSVHLRRAGDHVLDVVGVSRAIHVRVVTVGRLVLHVRRRDRDAALPLFRRVINRIERAELVLRVVLLQYLGDGRRQRRLAVIDVPDRPHVHVRLRTIKLFLRHKNPKSLSSLLLLVASRSAGGPAPAPKLYLPCARPMISSAIMRGASS